MCMPCRVWFGLVSGTLKDKGKARQGKVTGIFTVTNKQEEKQEGGEGAPRSLRDFKKSFSLKNLDNQVVRLNSSTVR